MEDAGPDERVELELRGLAADAVDEEVIVEVLADGEEVVVEFLNLLVLAQDLHTVHLVVDHRVEAFNQLFLKLVGKLVRREVTQSLID